MYLQHFRLEKSPFSLTPDPSFLFLTNRHREALAALLFAVTQRKGFMVLTGEAGTGKTTLVRKLLASVPLHCAQFSVVVNPALDRSELLESVLLDFGERNLPASKPMRLALFREHLWRAYHSSKTCALVIDEAHLLTADLLEEIRLLSNFETTEQKLLQIILVGQKELDNVLALDSMKQLRQRIAIRMHIEPLAFTEVGRYLLARWAHAGSPYPLPFSAEAVQLVARCSGGIPRLVNVICDAALVNAYGTGASAIGKDEIEEVTRDLGLTKLGEQIPAMNLRPVAERADRRRLAPTPEESEAMPLLVPVRQQNRKICIPSVTEFSAVSAAYSPARSMPPKRSRFVNWFGTTRSEAK